MSNRKSLSAYVETSLYDGQSGDQIRDHLKSAGWSKSEIEGALADWLSMPGQPPVPRPRPHIDARDAFLYVLILGTMLIAAISSITLAHSSIEWLFEEPNSYVMRQIRNSLAYFVVSAPIFFWLNARQEKKVAQDPGAQRSLIRRWLIYIVLAIGAFTLIFDAIYVLVELLNGALTLPFALKAGWVGLIATLGTMYYAAKVRERDQ